MTAHHLFSQARLAYAFAALAALGSSTTVSCGQEIEAEQQHVITRLEPVGGGDFTAAELRIINRPLPKDHWAHSQHHMVSRYELWLLKEGAEPVRGYAPPSFNAEVDANGLSFGSSSLVGGITKMVDIWCDGNRALVVLKLIPGTGFEILDLRKTGQWRFAGSQRINWFESGATTIDKLAFDERGTLVGENSDGQEINLTLAPDGVVYSKGKVLHPEQLIQPERHSSLIKYWNSLPSAENEWKRTFIWSRIMYAWPRDAAGDMLPIDPHDPQTAIRYRDQLEPMAEVDLPPLSEVEAPSNAVSHARPTVSPTPPKAEIPPHPDPAPKRGQSMPRLLILSLLAIAAACAAFVWLRDRGQRGAGAE